MTRRLTLTLVSCALALAPISGWAADTPPAPTAAVTLDKVLAAAGGQKAFADLGVLELKIEEQETRANGTTGSSSMHAYASGAALEYLRDESHGWALVRTGPTGWATRDGQLDQRPQTPKMAAGSVTASLFPLLLPFSLAMDGVTLGAVGETTFEGKPAWRVEVSFAADFFVSPVMNTSWTLYVSRADSSVLAIEFQPKPEFAQVANEGVRYRVMTSQTVGAVKLPAQVLLDGIDANGAPTGHTRVTKIVAAVRGPWDPTLFLNPNELKKIEGED